MRLVAIPALVSLAMLCPAEVESSPETPPVLELNALKGLYEPVSFDHEAHAASADGCRSCHHRRFGKLVSCGICHTEYVEREEFEHEPHQSLMECLSCHQVANMAEMRCSACHKTAPDPDQLYVIGLKGAFHQQCMGCHRELELDVSCAACHERGPSVRP
jgi:hypothetical protein